MPKLTQQDPLEQQLILQPQLVVQQQLGLLLVPKFELTPQVKVMMHLKELQQLHLQVVFKLIEQVLLHPKQINKNLIVHSITFCS